jgi:hypothetical protein
MKTALSAILILALFTGPTVCFLAVCTAQTGQHECCPRTQQIAACPFSFLAQSTGAVKVEKTVSFAIAGPASAALPMMPEQPGHSVPTLVADGRNLHVLNRILRI